MTSIEIHEVETSSGFDLEPGRDVGQMLAFGATVVAGSVLFAVSRKVTWGVEEPMIDWRLGALAITPYFLYLLAMYVALARSPAAASVFAPPDSAAYRARLLAYVRSTRLASLWTVALGLYVGMHLTSLSGLIEDPIYNALSLTFASFSILTVIYVTAALGLVVAASRFFGRDTDAAGNPGQPNALMFGYAFCLPLFLLFVFTLPLQS